MRGNIRTRIVGAIIVAGLSMPAVPRAVAQDGTPPVDTAAWRASHERTLRAPDGYLSVAGLFFVRPGVNTIGADPSSDIVLPAGAGPSRAGRLTVSAGVVRFVPAPGVAATLNQQPIRRAVSLRTSDPAVKRPADRIGIGRVTFHLHRTGDRLAVRLRDPLNPIRTQFTGLRWFPEAARWRVTGRFHRYATPRTVSIETILGDVEAATSLGEVHFAIDGRPLRLVALASGNRLWFVFRDGTSGTDTYRIRFLYADAPDSRGRVVLDFNRAYNPPCAYNPWTTCPLPPPENRLSVPIPAGERLAETPASTRHAPAAPAR